jgi:hypothetical protein
MITTTKGRTKSVHRVLLVGKDQTDSIGSIKKVGYSKWVGIMYLNGKIYHKEASTRRDIVDYFNKVSQGVVRL